MLNRTDRCLPDFLWSLVGSANIMRLSSLKAAHAVVGWSHVQEIRVAAAHATVRRILFRKGKQIR
jgi:hypothetical protein